MNARRFHSCCPVVRMFLQSIGVDAVNPTTPAEWLQHFEQERVHLFPRFPIDLAVRLSRDHSLFEHELRMFGSVRNLGHLELHSRIEDRAVMELLRARR